MTLISAKDFLTQHQKSPCFILDVRTAGEFQACHIPGATNIPLDLIERGQVESIPRNQPVFLICQSGMRSDRARKLLEAKGFQNLNCISGGIASCTGIAGAVVKNSNVLPIMRQVQLAAGSLVLLGFFLSRLVNPAFIYLSVFVGAGLTFAGATGFCGMAILLEKMPWNKISGPQKTATP